MPNVKSYAELGGLYYSQHPNVSGWNRDLKEFLVHPSFIDCVGDLHILSDAQFRNRIQKIEEAISFLESVMPARKSPLMSDWVADIMNFDYRLSLFKIKWTIQKSYDDMTIQEISEKGEIRDTVDMPGNWSEKLKKFK